MKYLYFRPIVGFLPGRTSGAAALTAGMSKPGSGCECVVLNKRQRQPA